MSWKVSTLRREEGETTRVGEPKGVKWLTEEVDVKCLDSTEGEGPVGRGVCLDPVTLRTPSHDVKNRTREVCTAQES